MSHFKDALPSNVSGFVWHDYSVQFESPDGRFSARLSAISDEHAELQLQALKETGVLAGRIIGEQDERL